jgi:hypothetical protein
LTIDPTNRPTADELLDSTWLKAGGTAKTVDLLPNVKSAFSGKKTCKLISGGVEMIADVVVRKAVIGMMAANRFLDRNGTHDPAQQKLAQEVQDCKDEAEKVSHVLINCS